MLQLHMEPLSGDFLGTVSLDLRTATSMTGCERGPSQ